ncbi:hypothetical protein OM428_00415 [Enterococcus gallinarum]|nr:hypothetical protein [Enterococcus gallinarum]
MQITYLSDPQEKKQIAQTILADLPEWFGLPESTADYIEKSAYQEMIVVENKGFLTLVKTSPATAEIYVMGVLKADHHQGIGSQLIKKPSVGANEKVWPFYRLRHWQRRIQTNTINVHEVFMRRWVFCLSKHFPPFGERKIHAC